MRRYGACARGRYAWRGSGAAGAESQVASLAWPEADEVVRFGPVGAMPAPGVAGADSGAADDGGHGSDMWGP